MQLACPLLRVRPQREGALSSYRRTSAGRLRGCTRTYTHTHTHTDSTAAAGVQVAEERLGPRSERAGAFFFFLCAHRGSDDAGYPSPLA